MSNNLPYYDKSSNGNYGSKNHRKKVRRLADRFESNREILAQAARLEEEEQQEAFAIYQKIREERKYSSNRDALLYHYDR